jgi:hypothetical protein
MHLIPRRIVNCLLLSLAMCARLPQAYAETAPYEQPPISYSSTAPHDAATKLNEGLTQGTTTLARDPNRGYLESLLKALGISPSSQILVFSKTSFQPKHISPSRPRAIYFNDDTYVGYVPGAALIEVASSDPKLGTTFYTVAQDLPEQQTKLLRQTDSCLQCHGESMTRDIPGLLVRSVFADRDGQPIHSAGTFLSTQESPLEERWGGWYVTGTTGQQRHMGNTLWREKEGAAPEPTSTTPTNTSKLPETVDASAYLTPHSDAVALMVLAHQTEMHNRMTRAAHGTLRALRDEKAINDAMGEKPQPGEHSDSTRSRIKSSCEPLVEYLLFAGETPLTDPIEGSSTFASEFSARGPRDSQGRSLREFDLKKRLFRYPCSYLIHSTTMTALPDATKDFVYRRLWEILTGNDTSKTFAHLSPSDRLATMQILRETNPEIRSAWSALEHLRK